MAKPLDVYVRGFDELGKLIQRRFMGNPRAQRESMLRAMWYGSLPTRDAAKAMYNSIGRSGSLATAMASYRWKDGSELGRGIRVGPKRSSAVGLRKWILYYRRPINMNTFTYGIRHAHLVEFGFYNVRAKRRIPGQYIMQRAGARHAKVAGPRAASVIGEIMNREAAKELRRAKRRKLR